MIRVGTIVESQSGIQYEVIKCWKGGWFDIRRIKAPYEYLPDFFPVINSEILDKYKIVNE